MLPKRLNLAALQTVIEALADMIGAPRGSLPSYGTSDQTGRPHIEISQVYHYVVAERGSERSREVTAELDLLLYWVFQDVTSQMAGEYELEHRRAAEDSRRLRFEKQLELLAQLSSDWAARQRADQAAILVLHQFQDG
jgi:hypothetical protein